MNDSGVYNIVVRAGDTFVEVVTWKTGDDPDNLTPVDLTGYSAEMVVVDAEGAPVLTISTGTEGGITLGGVSGTITLFAQTTGIVPGCYSYTLVLVSAAEEVTTDGVITTLLAGSFTLN